MDIPENKLTTPTNADNNNENKADISSDNKKENDIIDKKNGKDNTSEILDKIDKRDSVSKDKEKEDDTSKDIEKKDISSEGITKDENIKKSDSYSSLSHKSSNSSISTPKSILRKRKTGNEDDGSGDSIDDTSSTSSMKRKHIEFSDDNIVYTLEQEDEYDEYEDDEANKGHPIEYVNESIVYSIFVFIRRYLLFAIVIAGGFCFSYYSYHSDNKNPREKIQSNSKISGSSSIQEDNIVTSSEIITTKSPLQSIDSITISQIISADPTITSTSVFQSTSTVDSDKQNREDTSTSLSTSSSTLTSTSTSTLTAAAPVKDTIKINFISNKSSSKNSSKNSLSQPSKITSPKLERKHSVRTKSQISTSNLNNTVFSSPERPHKASE